METQNQDKKSVDWIVTPGLMPTIRDFVQLCEFMYPPVDTMNKPLMICGDTGVGKSLFVKIFENHFVKNRKHAPVVRINFAALDKNLIASELFGYIKGSFSGAYNNKDGLLEKANGGLLILEEIGELSEENQARLLTFIEDGKFYKIGSTEELTANIQIIGTTHSSAEKFRDDFRNRFFHFYVPALYERRLDVLYYLYHMHKNVLLSLRQNELLSLLAYHWPGNVREIDTIGLLIKWREPSLMNNSRREEILLEDQSQTNIDLYLKELSARQLLYNPNKYTKFFFRHRNFLMQFQDYCDWKHTEGSIIDIDIELLEFVITKCGFALPIYDSPYAFPKDLTIEPEDNKDLGLKCFNECEYFEKYSFGFSSLFKILENREYDMQSDDECFKRDLLSFHCGDSPEKIWDEVICANKDDFVEEISKDEINTFCGKNDNNFEEKFFELQKAIYEFRTNKKLENLSDVVKDKSPTDPVISLSAEQDINIDLCLIIEEGIDSFLYKVNREVYKNILEKTNGNKAKAARLLDLHENTFKNRLKQYGLL